MSTITITLHERNIPVKLPEGLSKDQLFSFYLFNASLPRTAPHFHSLAYSNWSIDIARDALPLGQQTQEC